MQSDNYSVKKMIGLISIYIFVLLQTNKVTKNFSCQKHASKISPRLDHGNWFKIDKQICPKPIKLYDKLLFLSEQKDKTFLGMLSIF